jgi:hypothetical protein
MEKDGHRLLSRAVSDDELGWRFCPPWPKDERDRSRATARVNIPGISALSRRLMAIERARALGRQPVNMKAWALELEARRWIQERAKQNG